MISRSDSENKRDDVLYLEHLVRFSNYDHAGKLIKRMIKDAVSDMTKKRLMKIQEHLKDKKCNSKIFAPIVFTHNGADYPLLYPMDIQYNTDSTIIFSSEEELIIRRAVSVVETHFAKKHFNLDIIPYSVHISLFEDNGYKYDCRSLELALAVSLYMMATGKSPERRMVLSGALDADGNIMPVTMVKEKLYAAKMEGKGDIFIAADNDRYKHFKHIIRDIFTKSAAPLPQFKGNIKRELDIAEHYLMAEDSFTYLPMYKNITTLTEKSYDASEKNIHFIALMRQAIHYNQAGNLEKADKCFKDALNAKDKLKKDGIFEYNPASVEFNNFYAVFLSDIYRDEKGMALLDENMKEKMNMGKHIQMTTKGTLAQYHIKFGRFKEADRLLDENEKIAEKYVKRDIARTKCYKAHSLILQKRFEEAGNELKDAVKALKYCNTDVQKTFIQFEKVRLFAHKSDITQCRKSIKKLEDYSRGTRYEYLNLLSRELLALAYHNQDAQKEFALLEDMAYQLMSKDMEIFYPFCIRGLLRNYMASSNKENIVLIRKMIDKMRVVKAGFKDFLINNAEKIPKEIL